MSLDYGSDAQLSVIVDPLAASHYVVTVRPGWPVPKPTMKAITERFAEDRGLSVGELRGPSRYRYVAWPRQELMWMLRRQGLWTFPQIARFFSKDHSTVIHSCRAHQERMPYLLG